MAGAPTKGRQTKPERNANRDTSFFYLSAKLCDSRRERGAGCRLCCFNLTLLACVESESTSTPKTNMLPLGINPYVSWVPNWVLSLLLLPPMFDKRKQIGIWDIDRSGQAPLLAPLLLFSCFWVCKLLAFKCSCK